MDPYKVSYWGQWNVSETAGYVGMAIWLLAFTALFARKQKPGLVWFWALIALAALLLAFGGALPFELNRYLFRVPVQLGALTPDKVLVELYANGLNGEATLRIPLEPDALSSAEGTYHYQALVTTNRPAGDFTVRLLPQYEGITVPLEDHRILWQR